MLKCNACGHQWTNGEMCPHCEGTDFEDVAVLDNVNSLATEDTPEPEVVEPIETEETEDSEEEEE